MREQDGVLVCSASGMDLSQKVREGLEELVAMPGAESISSRGPGHSSRWFCPADGTRLADAACPQCGREMPGWIRYNLIEVHQHP
jgi:hypothetical protein